MTAKAALHDQRRAIGERLREWRLRREMSQAEVARIAGITQASLSNYETGKRDLPLSTFLGVARALGVGLGDLLEIPDVVVVARLAPWPRGATSGRAAGAVGHAAAPRAGGRRLLTARLSLLATARPSAGRSGALRDRLLTPARAAVRRAVYTGPRGCPPWDVPPDGVSGSVPLFPTQPARDARYPGRELPRRPGCGGEATGHVRRVA